MLILYSEHDFEGETDQHYFSRGIYQIWTDDDRTLISKKRRSDYLSETS